MRKLREKVVWFKSSGTKARETVKRSRFVRSSVHRGIAGRETLYIQTEGRGSGRTYINRQTVVPCDCGPAASDGTVFIGDQ